MKHERQVKALREWTRRTIIENAKRSANRAWYLGHIGEYRSMSESEQLSGAGTQLRNNLCDRLREGIDPLPIPTVSSL
jgi:hypothetical protein